MLSCQLVSGPTADQDVVAGSALQWIFANDGTVAWSEMTTLRLVGGPVVTNPLMHVPAAEPGQTVIVDFEVDDVQEKAHVFYSMVTPEGDPFGEIVCFTVVPKSAPPPAKPVCVIVSSPMDGLQMGVDALQGEIKTMEWMIANVGSVPWPEDVSAKLFYNTPGLAHVPTHVDIPALEPGMTAHVEIQVLMPESAGSWKAMWAVTSPTYPEFGNVLFSQFEVSEFPFMEWMLTEENKAESISDASEQGAEPKVLAMEVTMWNHTIPGHGTIVDAVGDVPDLLNLGRVEGLAVGEHWMSELLLTNSGSLPWPEDTTLRCCFGEGFGCSDGFVGPLQMGETTCIQMELQVPAEEAPRRSAWVVASGDHSFGPILLLEVE